VKIDPRLFPYILVITFALFVLLGLALGWRPVHGGGGGHAVLLLPAARLALRGGR
jgi:hypothetical protein